jgi:hypothetical protein
MNVRRVTALKKTALLFVVSTFVVLIVLPTLRFVNQSSNLSISIQRTPGGNGDPLSLPLPAKTETRILVADGAPRPVPLPPSFETTIVVADGDSRPVTLPPRIEK